MTTTLQEALKNARRTVTPGYNRKDDWEKVICLFFETENQHTVAATLGIRQGQVSRILRKCGVCVGRGKRKEIHQIPWDQAEKEYSSGMSTTDLGKKYNVDAEVIRRQMERRGIARRQIGEYEKRGADNHQWKGGKTSKRDSQYSKLAREVARCCLGKKLPKGMVVHHADENEQNNRPDNLRTFPSNSHHCRFHQQLLRLQHGVIVGDENQLLSESGGQVLPPPLFPIQSVLDIADLSPCRKMTKLRHLREEYQRQQAKIARQSAHR